MCGCGADGAGPCSSRCTGPTWSGMCARGMHGLDYKGQPCDLCAVSLHGVTALIMRNEDVELHAWPLRRQGGQHTNGPSGGGVLAIHKPSGLAVVCEDERSQHKNRATALRRLTLLVAELPARRLQW